MISLLRRIVKSAAYRLGVYDTIYLNEYEPNSLLQNFFRILTKCNFQPKVVLDIGANVGGWSREALKYFPNSKFVLVEPQDWLKPNFQDLLDLGHIYYPLGIGGKSGERLFTINKTRDDSSTFRLSTTDAINYGFDQIKMKIQSLDDLIDDLGCCPDLIKIDAEGLDMEILTNSTKIWDTTQVLMVEAAINSSTTTPLIAVVNFMAEKNYKLFDITDLNKTQKHSALWLVELVFVKAGGSLDIEIDSYS